MTVAPILVYLAGPQDDVSKDEARGWREQLAASAPSGVAFFSPAHAYMNVSKANFPPVDFVNRRAIEASHAVIANLTGPGRAFGTIREIEFAVQHHTMVQVVGQLDHSLMTWDLTVVETLEEALHNVLENVAEIRESMAKRQGLFISLGPEPPQESE